MNFYCLFYFYIIILFFNFKIKIYVLKEIYMLKLIVVKRNKNMKTNKLINYIYNYFNID